VLLRGTLVRSSCKTGSETNSLAKINLVYSTVGGFGCVRVVPLCSSRESVTTKIYLMPNVVRLLKLDCVNLTANASGCAADGIHSYSKCEQIVPSGDVRLYEQICAKGYREQIRCTDKAGGNKIVLPTRGIFRSRVNRIQSSENSSPQGKE
jgi:hypothetical protein